MIITHSNVTEQLVSYFKENIVSGAWKVGEKIPSENQLTETLGVSRASVRTAIQQMVGLGILESRHGKGTYVMDNQVDEMSANKGKITAQDCKDLQKVLEFRRIVETEACYLATRYATDEFINELQRCLDTMASNKVNKENFIMADTAFHELICRESIVYRAAVHNLVENVTKQRRHTIVRGSFAALERNPVAARIVDAPLHIGIDHQVFLLTGLNQICCRRIDRKNTFVQIDDVLKRSRQLDMQTGCRNNAL